MLDPARRDTRESREELQRLSRIETIESALFALDVFNPQSSYWIALKELIDKAIKDWELEDNFK